MRSPPRPRGGAFLLPCILTGAGLSFLPGHNIALYKRLQRVLPCQCNIPPTLQNSAHGFTAAFSAIVPTQPPAIPDKHNKPLHRLRHAGGHTRARTRSTDTRYHRHAGTLYRSAQTAYYNKVYKRADHASPAGSASPPVNLVKVSPAGSRYFPRPAAGGLAPGQLLWRTV